MSIHVELTRAFNQGHLRSVLSSGPAVVLHRLTLVSKDGDWLLREDEESLAHVVAELARRGARYRFGAPLDVRCMRGGWSAHFQFLDAGLRIRTDFVRRPPRLDAADLERVWREAAGDAPFLGLRDLLRVKMTDREKDWPVVGELARRLADPRDGLLHGRSARDLADLARDSPELAAELARRRPLLARIAEGRESLEAALDAERRARMRENEQRLAGYEAAARGWAAAWPETERAIAGRPLEQAHAILVERALSLLPFAPARESADGA